MDLFLTLLVVIPGVLLFFGASIFLHELGHFWVARKLGMRVEKFAIGFGPKAWCKVKDGIEYSVRWIPAGGFVALPQMITAEVIEGTSEDGEKIPPAPPSHRILVALAGPAMNVLFAFAIASVLYFTGIPKLVNPSFIADVKEGSPEAEMGIRPGDRIVEINGKPVRTWEEIVNQVVLSSRDEFRTTIDRDGERKSFTLKAVPISEGDTLKRLNLQPLDNPYVASVEQGAPADVAGVKAGDKIVSFAGEEIVNFGQMIDLVQESAGRATELVVDRDGSEVALSVTPDIIDDQPLGEEEKKRARIGIRFGNGIYKVQQPGDLPWVQVADTAELTFGTVNALFHSKQTGVGLKHMSGPPGILFTLAGYFNTDIRLALKFLVLLNVNLAILNLLPIPVLDGGHIVMAIIEKLIRRPLSMRVVEYATMGFAVALISLMLYVSVNDVRKFGMFVDFFKSENKIEQADSP